MDKISVKKERSVKGNAIKREILNVLATFMAAAFHALGIWIFVEPAKFAASEMSGIFTMLYQMTGINVAYFSLLFNIPLIIVAWFLLRRKYVVYTLLFILFSSVILIFCEQFPSIQYNRGGEEMKRLLAALFSGVIFGVRTGVMLKMGASCGGTDIIAGLIHRKLPYLNVERIIVFIGYAISISSYFYYGDVTSILLALVQNFVLESVASLVMKDRRGAIEVKIITKNPEELREDIVHNLRHSATILKSTGMYSEEDTYMVVCVLNTYQVPDVERVIKKYPNTFVYYSTVMGVKGNFRWRKDEEVK